MRIKDFLLWQQGHRGQVLQSRITTSHKVKGELPARQNAGMQDFPSLPAYRAFQGWSLGFSTANPSTVAA
jgi:hypothetical protein